MRRFISVLISFPFCAKNFLISVLSERFFFLIYLFIIPEKKKYNSHVPLGTCWSVQSYESAAAALGFVISNSTLFFSEVEYEMR
jgi:hypothetical protein